MQITLIFTTKVSHLASPEGVLRELVFLPSPLGATVDWLVTTQIKQ